MPAKLTPDQAQKFLQQLQLPAPNSHKGDNGKLLIIGGSNLFHAASRWSLDISSKFVDMVFYSSVPSNNALIKEAKQNFWNGIVVPRLEVEKYLTEADCILIGPGMERTKLSSKFNLRDRDFYLKHPPSREGWQHNTQKIVNYLVAKYPDKKWVIDAGALQMLDPTLLTDKCIITPHPKELKRLLKNLKMEALSLSSDDDLLQLSSLINHAAILLKGPVDKIIFQQEIMLIKGGNAGMTKGGTGDVLAGLLAGLYTTNEMLSSLAAASYINKKTGDSLYDEVGPFFNATDLMKKIPQVLWSQVQQSGGLVSSE